MSDLVIRPDEPDSLIPDDLSGFAFDDTDELIDRWSGVIAEVKDDAASGGHGDDCSACRGGEYFSDDAAGWPQPHFSSDDLDCLDQWAAGDGLRRSS